MGTGGQIQAYSLRGSAPDGTDYSSDTYLSEFSDQTNINFGSKAFHCWTDIRLVLYSILTTPTKFTLELIHFADDEYPLSSGADILEPFTYPQAASTALTPANNLDIFNFWGDMIKPYVFNPIMTHRSRWQYKYKVLKRKEFIVQPRSTVNSDTTTPNTVELRWFHDHNTVRRYDWNNTRPVTNNIELVNDDDTPLYNNGLINARNVEPKKRVFFVIKAQALNYTAAANPIDSTAVASGNTLLPSYDIIIRNKYLNTH